MYLYVSYSFAIGRLFVSEYCSVSANCTVGRLTQAHLKCYYIPLSSFLSISDEDEDEYFLTTCTLRTLAWINAECLFLSYFTAFDMRSAVVLFFYSLRMLFNPIELFINFFFQLFSLNNYRL